MKRLPLITLLVLAPLASWANIIPTGTSIDGSTGGPYIWSYQLQLSSDQDAMPGTVPTDLQVGHANLGYGSFLTIFDFAGYVAGSCRAPDGWTCTAQNVGYTPVDVSPVDDIGITNLTWVYTSGPVLTGNPVGLDLGVFRASSMYGTSTFVSYAARGMKNNGPAIGTDADNVGITQGPSANEVPEPASLALAGLALALMSFALPKTKTRAP